MTNTLYFRTYRSYGHFPYKIVDHLMRSILLVSWLTLGPRDDFTSGTEGLRRDKHQSRIQKECERGPHFGRLLLRFGRLLRSVQPSRPQTCYLHAHVTDRTMTRMHLKFENDYVTFALTHLLWIIFIGPSSLT